ncbi:MAG: transposase zinc-binding domain-containing protein, partial [Myxococcales bacterium]|nr:transposase zinc-binding domain-containing protein [Myxococcales bacterium]
MPTLADVVRAHGGSYVARHPDALLPSHVRALGAIADCRTEALGAELAACHGCGHARLVYHSCRHRACPRCGHDATERWLARHRQALLPVPYFHVVFTLRGEHRSSAASSAPTSAPSSTRSFAPPSRPWPPCAPTPATSAPTSALSPSCTPGHKP